MNPFGMAFCNAYVQCDVSKWVLLLVKFDTHGSWHWVAPDSYNQCVLSRAASERVFKERFPTLDVTDCVWFWNSVNCSSGNLTKGPWGDSSPDFIHLRSQPFCPGQPFPEHAGSHNTQPSAHWFCPINSL